MKRFFLVSAIAIIFAVLISVNFNSALIFSCLLAGVIFLCVLLGVIFKLKLLKSIICFAVISVLMFTYSTIYLENRETLKTLQGSTATFKGTIVEEPQDNGDYYTYIVKPDKDSFDKIDFDFKLKLNSKFNTNAEIYDRIEACVDISELYEKMKLSYYSDNIMLSGKIRYCAVYKTENKPIFYLIKKHFKNLL